MWATEYTANNDHVSIPGILSDGRLFTDYTTDSVKNFNIGKHNNISTNEEYRRFLMNHTNEIIQNNYEYMIRKNGTSYGHNQHPQGPPKLYTTIDDDSKPFGYEDSTPKQMYLSREQINDKKRRLLKEEY